MYQFEILTTTEEWLPYKEKWQQIINSNKSDNPFLEFDLLYTWWKTIGKNEVIKIFVCTLDGIVQGFRPLQLISTKQGKQYQFMGNLDLNYMDFVILEENKQHIIPAFLNELLDGEQAVTLELRGVEEASSTNEILEHTCMKERYLYNFTRTVSPYTSLVETPREVYAPVNKTVLQKRIKRLNKIGNLKFRYATEKDLPEIFALFDKRWQKKMDTSGFTAPEKQAFFQEMIRYDITKVEVLVLDDTLIGFSYCFSKGSRFVCYLHSFDEDYRRFGAGNLLDYFMTIRRYEENVDILDFSIGYEDYKYRWATHSNFVRTYYIANNSGKAIWQKKLLLGKCIEITKKSPKIVQLKRNTLGTARYWLRNYRDLSRYTQENIFTKEVELYRLPARTLKPLKTAEQVSYRELQGKLSPIEIDLLYRQYQFYNVNGTIIQVNDRTCKDDDWYYTILLKKNERYIPNMTISYADKVARNFNDKMIYTKVDASNESLKNILKNLGFVYVTTMQVSRFFKQKKMFCDDFEVIDATKVTLTK